MSGLYLAAKVIPGLIMAGFTVLAIRIMDPRAYARFSMFWAGSLVVTSISVGWLRHGILRYRPSEPGVVRLSGIAGFFTAAAVAIGGVATAEAAPTLALALAALGLALAHGDYQVVGAYFLAMERPYQVLRMELLRAITATAAFAALSLSAYSDSQRMGALALACLTGGYVSTAAMTQFSGGHRYPDRQLLRSAWKFGWPMSMWMGASLATQYLDRFMLAALTSVETAGLYAAGYDVAVRGTTLLLAPFTLALHPAYMRLRAAGHIRIATRILRTAGAVLVLAIFIGVIAISVFYARVSPWLGLETGMDRTLFGALFISAAAWNIALVMHKPLEFAGRTRFMLGCIVAGFGLNAGANVILIPVWSMWGAVAATLASTALYLGLVGVAGASEVKRLGL